MSSKEINYIVKYQCLWKYTKKEYEENLIPAEGKGFNQIMKVEYKNQQTKKLQTDYICGKIFDIIEKTKPSSDFPYRFENMDELYRHHMESHNQNWQLGKIIYDIDILSRKQLLLKLIRDEKDVDILRELWKEAIKGMAAALVTSEFNGLIWEAYTEIKTPPYPLTKLDTIGWD